MEKRKQGKLKILYIDFETCTLIGQFYGSIWETNIVKIIRHQQITSGSYGWHGESKVYSVGQDDFKGYKKGVFNDKEIVKFFADLCLQADYIVMHNGDSFDIKVLNARILFHRLTPIPPKKTFDTKKQAKSGFYFPSNKLDHIADFLGIKRKIDIRLPEVTDRCEKGDPKAWKELKEYGKRDTVVLKDVFKLILPYVKLPAVFSKAHRDSTLCPNPVCGSSKTQRRGTETTKGGVLKQRYQCQKCGRWFYGEKIK